MSRHTGYGIGQDEHGLVGVSVRVSKNRWQVQEISRSETDGELSKSLQTAMAKALTPVTWVAADGETHLSHQAMPRLKGTALRRAFKGGLARDEGGRPDDWSVTWQQIVLQGEAQVRAQQPFVMYYAPLATVNAKMAVAEQWGVELERLLPGHLVLDMMYRAHGPQRADHQAWNLVFVGRNQQFLCVSTREAQLVVRQLPPNLSSEKNDAEYLQRLATEIERSAFFARQTEYSPEVEQIIVCGDPDLAGPLVEVLAGESSIPAVHWQLEDSFDWGDEEFDSDDLVVLSAAVLALGKTPFNLVPPHSRWHLSRRTRRQVLVAGATSAAVIIPLLVVGGVLTARVQESYLGKAEIRLATVAAQARHAEEVYQAQRVLLAREDRMSRFVGSRPDFEAVLLKLADLTPNEVVFTRLQVQEKPDGSFHLRLQGESRAGTGFRAQAAFLKFLGALDNCEFLVRDGEPRLMRIRPALETDGTGERDKTTVFDLDLVWQNVRKEAD